MTRFVILLLLVTTSPVAAQSSPAADSLLQAAMRQLETGWPWRATRTIAPALASQGSRPPAVILLAARAAAGWQGWNTVARLLGGQVWLDQEEAGAGRALLARATVERADGTAVAQALMSLRPAGLPPRERGSRLVTLARALDRAGALDSSAATYQRAAELLPEIGDWLRLRAAGVQADSGRRAALYSAISLPPASPRVGWTEALARERTGDPVGAAVVYDRLGARLASVRLKLAAARGPDDMAAVRRELVALLGTRLPIGDARDAVALMDGNFTPLTRAEELLVARRAAAASLLDRAARGFARAARAGRLPDADRYSYATVLSRLGRHREAVREFDAVRDPGLRAQARYQRARSLFRTATAPAALAALREVRDSFPGSAVTAATAGWLVADWYVDQGNDARARREFAQLARQYPGTSHGQRAAFQAALLAYLAGDLKAAAAGFDAIADGPPSGSEVTASAYWSGRVWFESGDTTRARQRWQHLVDHQPQSYYVVPAARRLGANPFLSPDEGDPPAPVGEVDSALARAALLDSLGMTVEARFERDWVGRSVTGDPAGLVARATAIARGGQPARGLALAQQVVARGAPVDQAVLRLLYPLVDPEVLASEARAVGLPPLLVAGLIRQESAFDARARSRADARGMMQVLPSVGAAAARQERFPEWDDALLYQPDVNLHIGLRHLADRWERCGGNLEAALAAYNAGSTPVNRWLERAGSADADAFIERIPYVETRDYVRRVLYNQARYESVYPALASVP